MLVHSNKGEIKPKLPGERLQKVLSQQGLGSRREIESWIVGGRIKVNDKTAALGARVGPADKIQLDDELITSRPSAMQIQTIEVLLYYKPEGEICSKKDPEDRPSVFTNLPKPKSGRWIMVGRLDFNTSGLLLFTNDGEFANQLMHPRHELEREYAVRILGKISDLQIKELKTGVMLEDGPAKFHHVSYQGGEHANHWYRVVIKEGRNREVRRIFASLNLSLNRLMRIRFGSVNLPRELKKGQFMFLQNPEINKLKALTAAATHFR